MIGTWNYSKLVRHLDDLNNLTNKMAEDVKVIKEKMKGKGIYPVEAPITIAQLQEIEDKLRQIGSNKDYPLPVD